MKYKVHIKTEDFPLDFPAVVPFLVSQENGDIVIEIYKGLEKAAELYAQRYITQPFSRSALDFINKSVDEYLTNYNYKRDVYGSTRYYIQYRPAKLNEKSQRKDSVKMSRHLENCENITSIFDCEKGILPSMSFVTVVQGKIVSAATVNEMLNDTLAEITVNTAPNYRGRGYGASNVYCLTKYLLSIGKNVAYCASRYNTASNKLALKCGFKPIGKFYAASAYKI